MVKLVVDGNEVEVCEGSTVLQACEAAGKEIPRFCYHERLSIAGNCRMCLVEMERSPKPIASCAMPAGEGMVIKTDSAMVRKAREGVMEFMLLNHPLDCPICDQGGECDLQDQAMGYGVADSRYRESKRAVENKSMGPLISAIMTRCIHCTRCVRFATEVAGVSDMGAIGRGESMEITTYLEKALGSELSGNVVDLCPVGALTSRSYGFTARPWELTRTESFDAMDAVGSAIRIDSRGNEVMRILPRVNDDVNEEWISDKTRYAYDGLKRQRIDRPYLRQKDGRLAECSWEEAFGAIAERVRKAKSTRRTKPCKIGAIIGDQCDAESMFALKSLMQKLDSGHIDCRQDGSVIGTTGRSGYIFNSGFGGIEDTDYVLLVGANPRHEAAVLNARLRRRWLHDGLEIERIGMPVDLTYPVKELGNDPSVIKTIEAGTSAVAKKLKKAKKPMIIIGQSALVRQDSKAILGALSRIAQKMGVVSKDWNGFNILHLAAARVGGLDLGIVPGRGGMGTKAMLEASKKGGMDVLYLLGADECDLSAISKKTFVIYQGSHGDAGAQIADVVLAGAAWCEKDAIFVNSEGRVQYANRATFPPGDAREDWKIIRALSAVLDATLDFSSHDELRQQMIADVPHFATPDLLVAAPFDEHGSNASINKKPFEMPVGQISMGAEASFYMTCPISRASTTMADCIKVFDKGIVDEPMAEKVAQ